MVCIYCDRPTKITNSRPQLRLKQTWRRHHCLHCGADFTTIEHIDLSKSLAVKAPDGSLQPFERDKLYISVHAVCGHRKSPTSDATALTATAMGKILSHATDGVITREQLVAAVQGVLQAFDTAAAVQYLAYHPFK